MPLVETQATLVRKQTLALPQRPKRERDAYGPKRTEAEIKEAKVYKAYVRDRANKEKARAAMLAWERLCQLQGLPTPVRCPWCFCVRTERPYLAPCDVCGTIRESGESG